MQLQAFFSDTLWNVHVLQLAHSENSIRHALLALSAYHELYINGKGGAGDGTFALINYNLAIRGILKPGAKPHPLYVQLISCLIFICVEVSPRRQGCPGAMG